MKESRTETLFVSIDEYDYHSLIKTMSNTTRLGNISIYDASNGYLLVFRNCVEGAPDIFKRHLDNLTKNIKLP